MTRFKHELSVENQTGDNTPDLDFKTRKERSRLVPVELGTWREGKTWDLFLDLFFFFVKIRVFVIDLETRPEILLELDKKITRLDLDFKL